jgi:DNA polymerase
MTSDAGGEETPFSKNADQVRRLLSEVSRSLRFYAESGYSGGQCRRENRDRLDRWSAADCLSPKGGTLAGPSPLSACADCPLRTENPKAIAGVGPVGARLMFLLGYPSFSTDREGHPYAGEAGKLLVKIISAMKLSPDDVYVTHAVKCRPPDGRPPSAEETRCCLPLLDREIGDVAPVAVFALGEFAAQTLLDSREPLAALRGRFYDRAGLHIMPTWHPHDMIDDPSRKRPAWDDVRQVMQYLDIT